MIDLVNATTTTSSTTTATTSVATTTGEALLPLLQMNFSLTSLLFTLSVIVAMTFATASIAVFILMCYKASCCSYEPNVTLDQTTNSSAPSPGLVSKGLMYFETPRRFQLSTIFEVTTEASSTANLTKSRRYFDNTNSFSEDL